ncbi:MAG TPA: response regulator [Chloroflexi bacterium]|nr:response regulator [Chloroflexota bacterium]
MSEKQTILVVDDDVQLVDTVKTLLESVGYEVAYAYQTEKGMDLAEEIRPDLILLDVMFAGPPGPDGIEVSRRLHENPVLRDTPVIILSGVKKVIDFSFDYSPDPTWMPVKAFLEKPIKPDELLGEIKKALAGES